VGRGTAVVHQIEEAGGAARCFAAELTDPAGVAQLAAEAGDVDVLANNADLDLEMYDRLWDGNVRSAFLLAAALAPGMARRGRGSINSMAGHVGIAGGAAYGATKAGGAGR
jgi:NAD(P)-dependent dehydrogenase (short-subunit alcohol dehydrogenase family)